MREGDVVGDGGLERGGGGLGRDVVGEVKVDK